MGFGHQTRSSKPLSLSCFALYKCVSILQTGFVTGSADSDVKFWDFELSSVKNGSLQHKLLKAVLKRTLKMTGDVLALKHS